MRTTPVSSPLARLSLLGVVAIIAVVAPGAPLEAQPPALELTKSFVDDPLAPGAAGTLRFSVLNRNRLDPATGITFSDDLDATLTGLVAVPPLPVDPCGAGSTLAGTSVLTLTGGTAGPGESCSFEVTVQVPADATPGSYPNTTSTVSATVGGSPVVGPAATDELTVAPYPLLEKSFLADPVPAGGTATFEISLTNSSPTDAATDISFFDDLTAFLGLDSTAQVVGLPAAGFCGAGSTATALAMGESVGVQVAGASLAAGDSCSFEVTVAVPEDLVSAVYTNATDAVTATVGGSGVSGPGGSASVGVVTAPELSKAFVDGPIAPGAMGTLELTLSYDPSVLSGATDITFTDDLDATLAGLVAVGLPMSDVCGPGSAISGTSVVTLTGASLGPGESCTIPVTVSVPAGAASGQYLNTTSTVTAETTAAGVVPATVTGPAATGTLIVQALSLTKTFLGVPAVAGGTVTLELTVTNDDAAAATDIAFTDDLEAALTGLVATGLPMSDVCGAGSEISGASVLSFTGGSLAAGTSCTFQVTLQVPGDAEPGEYLNQISSLTATVGGSQGVFFGAEDVLPVVAPLALTKQFVDDPVPPGGTVILELVVENLSPTEAATGITFADNLEAALPGLVAVGLPMSDVCGAGSELAGTSIITLTGGTLPAGGSCTIPVTLQVPADASSGTVATNTTSSVQGTVGGVAVTGAPATDDLAVMALVPPLFSQAFAPATIQVGGTTTLTFTIDNTGSPAAATGLDFSEVLPAGLEIATPSGAATTCTGGMLVADAGTVAITYTGGTVAAGAVCTVQVQVLGAAAGDYTVVSGELTSSAGSSGTSSAPLSVLELPPPVLEIPTASTWGLLLLAGFLGLAGAALVGTRG